MVHELLLLVLYVSAQTQDKPVQLEDVQVFGRRGSASVAAEVERGADWIDSLGAWSIGDVVAEARRQHASGEQPLIIINGRRVPSASIYMDLPPDALERVEVLPPGAAGRYGGSGSGRVLNLVLAPSFKSKDGRASLDAPTAGGLMRGDGNLRLSSLEERNVHNITLTASDSSDLAAEDRPAYVRDHPGSEGTTLQPQTSTYGARASLNRALGAWTSGIEANANQFDSESVSRLGANDVRLSSLSRAAGLRGSLSGETFGWNLQASFGGSRSDSTTRGVQYANTITTAADMRVLADRILFELSAGPVRGNLRAETRTARSEVSRKDQNEVFSSDVQALDVQLELPLISEGPLGFHRANLTVGGGRSQSDAGGGATADLGLNWSPTPKVNINVAHNRRATTPGESERFAPVTLGPSTVVYDFRRNESVEVSTLIGGNPDLQAQETQRTFVSVSAGPLPWWNVSGSIGFSGIRERNGVLAGLQPTPENEAAFPTRFARDTEGRLTQIDQRPLNLASSDSRSVNTGFNASLPMGQGAGSGRLFLNFARTWVLQERASVLGLPPNDRLGGDGGGVSPGSTFISVTGNSKSWSFNLQGQRTDGYRVRRNTGRDSPDDLALNALTRFDAEVSRVLGSRPTPAGAGTRSVPSARVTVRISNVFDARQKATLADGRAVAGFGRDDRDPLGRLIRLTLSRRF